MQVALDPCDRTTAYADLREQESLTDEVRAMAIVRARELAATHVEFWRPPYGQSPNRMEGFVELVRVPSAPKQQSHVDEIVSEQL